MLSANVCGIILDGTERPPGRRAVNQSYWLNIACYLLDLTHGTTNEKTPSCLCAATYWATSARWPCLYEQHEGHQKYISRSRHQVESSGDAVRLNDVGRGQLISTGGPTSRRHHPDSNIWQTVNAVRHPATRGLYGGPENTSAVESDTAPGRMKHSR